MPQQPVETILIRQLAGYLSVPVVILNPTGDVVFYNEPAELLLGIRFGETGRLTRAQFEALVEVGPVDGAGSDAPAPAVAALTTRQPAHAPRRVKRRSDGAELRVELTAFPIIGQGEVLHGAVAMFWEQP